MKFFLKIFIALSCLFALTVAFLFYQKGENAHEQESDFMELVKVANRMEVAAVGLGKIERSKMIDGRLYKNFVQLLHTSRVAFAPEDSFVVDCPTGARITLYKDSVPLEEFRMTTSFGREGKLGRWTPTRLTKINKFLKDVGVPFRSCEIENFDAVENRTLLTMPKLRHRRKGKNVDSSAAVDKDSKVNIAEKMPGVNTTDSVLDFLKPQVTQTLNDLDGLIFPADTALGTPLYEIAENSNRIEISFVRKSCNSNESERSDAILLDTNQIKKFSELLKNFSVETFAGTYTNPVRGEINLYKDSARVMSLWIVGKGFGFLEKHQSGADFEQGGLWFKNEPNEMNALFEPIELAAFPPCEKMN